MKKNAAVIGLFFMALLSTQYVYGEVSLSVSPVSGSNSLRFGRLGASEEDNKEVRIRISSSDSKQYQVFQRMVEPLSNEKGQMASIDTLLSYSLIGSNSSGSLYLDNIDRVSGAQQLVYSSDTSGTSDAFTVVYVADGSRLGASGNYFGKIAFTVRTLGGSSQEVAYLNVFIDSRGELKVDVQEANGRDYIRLESGDDFAQEKYLKISYTGNPGAAIRIYQQVEIFPHNELFEEIGDGVVQMSTSGDTRGNLEYQVAVALEKKKNLIYSSKETEDEFFVNFFLDNEIVANQKAGKYKGKAVYIVESDSFVKEFSYDIEIEVAPVFTYEVNLPPGGVSFDKVLPMGPPQVSEVEVKVKTNLGKPYMVVQDVASPLSNEKGDVFEKKNFTMKVEMLERQTGKPVFSEFKQVPSDESPIFYSNSKGSSASFKVYYRLRPYENMSAGDFTTSIVYSLGEI